MNSMDAKLVELYVRLNQLREVLVSLNETLDAICSNAENVQTCITNTAIEKQDAAIQSAAQPEQDTMEVPVKRRRGRPKKNISTTPVENRDTGDKVAPGDLAPQLSASDLDHITGELVQPQTDALPDTLPKEENSPVVPATPKRRGRPKKNASLTKAEKLVTPQQDDEAADTVNEVPMPTEKVEPSAGTASVTVKKKRGRPRKNPVVVEPVVAESIDQAVEGLIEESVEEPIEEPVEEITHDVTGKICKFPLPVQSEDTVSAVPPEGGDNVQAASGHVAAPDSSDKIIKLKRGTRGRHKKTGRIHGPWEELKIGKRYDVMDSHKAIKNAEYTGTESVGGLVLYCFLIGAQTFKFSEPSLRKYSVITESTGQA